MLSCIALFNKRFHFNKLSSEETTYDDYGFYIQLYSEKIDYVAQMISGIRYFYPFAHIYLISDNGQIDFTPICNFFECIYELANETIGVDRGRPPYTYSCSKHFRRISRAMTILKTKWLIYWESDTRALGRAEIPNSGIDLLQMGVHPNRFNARLPLFRSLFPNLMAENVVGWSSSGGTRINVMKLRNLTMSFYESETWLKVMNIWTMPDKTADLCIFMTAIASGLKVGQSSEYMRIDAIDARCGTCIAACQKLHRGKKWTSWEIPPPIDLCIFQNCECPPIIADMKHTWTEY